MIGRSWSFAIALLALCFLVVACNSDGAKDDTDASGSKRVDDEQTTQVVGEGWEVTLATDHQDYPAGEPVRLNLKFSNNSQNSLELTFPSAKTHDFTVADKDGRLVWQWSAERAFAQMLTERAVVAGSGITRAVTWDGLDNDGNQVEPGDYEITGWFTALGYDERVGPIMVEIK